MKRWRRVPWKRNIRFLPKAILDKVKGFPTDSCVVSCVVKIPSEQIKTGTYKHLKLCWPEEGLKYEPRVMPLPAMGKYSHINAYGLIVVRKDLGLKDDAVTFEAPNYGDWDKGSHTMEFWFKKYQRDFVGPKQLEILVEHLGEDVRSAAQVFKFTVDEVLQRNKSKFRDSLFGNANLLQENVGNYDAFPSTASTEEYLKTLYVNWEILPPGEREDNLKRILSNIRDDNPRIREKIAKRYDYLAGLKPKDFVRGTNGFRSYFGARFADDLVVFENIDYGNAIYVMFEDWQELSQKSRLELLSGTGARFIRIPHIEAWKQKLKKIVDEGLAQKAA